jgi:hypothetical protein
MTAVMLRVLHLCTLCVLFVSAPAAGQVASFDPDTIRAGRFDMGKMWPFEYAPLHYFS